MKPIQLLLLLALITAACQLCDAATPSRAQWLKEPSKPTHTSANPLLQWWSALTTGHTSPAVPSDVKEPAECIWQDFPIHDALKAWEFQAQPRRHMVRDRDKAIHNMEQLLRRLSDDPASGVTFVEDSRWMAVFREVTFQVSTRHGHPLHPHSKDEKHSQPFPWKGLAYLRLRQYKVLTPAGAYVPTAAPGMADLTLKMKAIDPDKGPAPLQLPGEVGASKLTAKLEYDGHCDHGRISMSPLYRPVDQELNVSRIANVRQWYPNLAEVARLDEQEDLPFMHDVYRAKIVWTVLFNGVMGEANLVIKYNTTLQDAVAGHRPKNGEVSLRIRRDVAEATGTTGEDAKKKLHAALLTVGRAMQAFRDHGWDGKTPSVPRKSDSNSCCGCGCKCGCDCKHCGDSPATAAAAATDANKCGCGCKCGCDCKHCGDSSTAAVAATAAAAPDANTCGCGCKCGCDCKHCSDSAATAAAAPDANKCGCGCKCGCDCKHCSDSAATAAAAPDTNKCGCGCKCGCDCKHCSDSAATAAASPDANKCGCGCKCGCDCKHCGDSSTATAAAAAPDANKCGCGCKGADGFKLFGVLPRPLLWRSAGRQQHLIRLGEPGPVVT